MFAHSAQKRRFPRAAQTESYVFAHSPLLFLSFMAGIGHGQALATGCPWPRGGTCRIADFEEASDKIPNSKTVTCKIRLKLR